MALCPPLRALDINLTLANGSASPGFDPGAVQLGNIMRAAADHWESIIRDQQTIDILYGYGDLGSDKSAVTCFTVPGDACIDGEFVEERPNRAKIVVDTAFQNGQTRQWYVDYTPYDHTEFDMQQVLYRDLSNSEQLEFFNGNVPDLLEVAYIGDALPSSVLVQGTEDLLTMALHEIGHALGMLNELVLPEVSVGHYVADFNSVFGHTVEINTAANDTEHFLSDISLMDPNTPKSQRRLPSATDVLAVAVAGGWQDIHLPRRDFWGGQIWSIGGTWAGNTVPDDSTAAWVRHGADAILHADGDTQDLVVRDDSEVQTSSHRLEVLGVATVEGGEGIGDSLIEVEGELFAGSLQVRDGGRVEVDNGQVSALQIVIDPGGVLSGRGELSTWALDNEGTLQTSGNGSLDIITVPGSLDLDGGNEAGTVQALAGDLRWQVLLSDSFDSSMDVGPGQEVEAMQPWTLGPGGALHLGESGTLAWAWVEGSELTLQGTVQVAGRGRIDAPLQVQSSAAIQVEADAILDLRDASELQGGSYTGSGTLRLSAPVTVSEDTVLQTAVVDLDGHNGATSVTMANSTLDLLVQELGDNNNAFHGELTVQGWQGRLGIQLQDPSLRWTLEGALNLQATDITTTTQLSGSDLLVNGSIQVDGRAALGTNIELSGTLSTVDVHTDAVLAGGGSNIFHAGAAVNGPGEVIVGADTSLELEDGFDSWVHLVNRGQLDVDLGSGAGSARAWTYEQADTGTIDFDLRGPTAGSQHDQLNLLQDIDLAGRIEVQLGNGFVPVLGDSFVLLFTSFGTVNGSWDLGASTLPALGPGLQWQVDYGSDAVTLEVVSSP